MTDLLTITPPVSDREEENPDPGTDWATDHQLDEDGAWAADQLRAYQLAFRFIDEIDAAAEGEIARFSLSTTALGCAFATIMLPGKKPSGSKRRKGGGGLPLPFILTLAPERVRVTARAGSLVAETALPLVRRAAVRSAGLSLALNPDLVAPLFGRGRNKIDWGSEKIGIFSFAPAPTGGGSGLLTLDIGRTHLGYDADEVVTDPPLPTLETAPTVPLESARALARGLAEAANVPLASHIGVIVVKNGVALGATSQHIIEYREPWLAAFDLAVSVADARPLRSILRRFGAPLRLSKVTDRLLLSDGVTSCSVEMSQQRIASYEPARENAMAAPRITMSVPRLFEAISAIGVLTVSGRQMARFEVRQGDDGHSLYLASQTPTGWGEALLTSLAQHPDIDLPENGYFDLTALRHAVQPLKFDAAELYLGSLAGMIVQYRGEASLTQIFAYMPPQG